MNGKVKMKEYIISMKKNKNIIFKQAQASSVGTQQPWASFFSRKKKGNKWTMVWTAKKAVTIHWFAPEILFDMSVYI